jgi:hypothetical protein
MSGRGAEAELVECKKNVLMRIEDPRFRHGGGRFIQTTRTNIKESHVPDDDVILIFAENKRGQYYCIFIMQRIVLQVNLQ